MERARRTAALAAMTLSLGGAARAIAQGCAMCGSSFGQGDPSINAFRVSILFMMAAPYTILAVVGVWLYLSARRARRGHPRGRLLPFPWGSTPARTSE